ncbi:FAD dependent oxidoreductase [Tricladium varicosporioides]|nr:FAD dependent oxidoreductase [Hymenoscyphus varicosporioides]
MGPSPIPVPNPTISFWMSEPHPLSDHQTTPELPPEIEIAVVGAGYSGVSTVYNVLSLCKSQGAPIPSIMIFEARQACSGATGRNVGGHMKADPFIKPSNLIKTHGVKAALECAEFEFAHLRAIKRIVEEDEIDCDFVLTRTMDVFMSEEVCTTMLDKVKLLEKNGLKVLDDVYSLQGAEAEQFTGVKGAKGCLTYSTAHLSANKFVLHLLSKVVDAGVNLQTHTPVESISKSPDSNGFFLLSTPRGTVRAKKVVHATNGYISSVLPEFADRIVPVRGVCSHIVLPKEKQYAPLLQNSYTIYWSSSVYDYMIPRLDGSIILGKSKSKQYGVESWYDNVNDDKLIEGAASSVENYMQRYFRGWESSGAYIKEIWSGIMGYSTDAIPHVGVIPDRREQFILAGFTGNGMPLAFLCARGVASMVLEGDSFESTGIPSVFKTTQERLNNSRNLILEDWDTILSQISK